MVAVDEALVVEDEGEMDGRPGCMGKDEKGGRDDVADEAID